MLTPPPPPARSALCCCNCGDVKQFLDAYKSVVMKTMAAAFGVGEPFLDKELSRFIAAGRLNAKIDKVRDPDPALVLWF